MGEAKRRKQSDPTYGKVRNLTHRKLGMPTTLPSGFSPDFGEYLIEYLPSLGLETMHIFCTVSHVMPLFYADMKRAEITTAFCVGEQTFCATFSFPCQAEYHAKMIAKQMAVQGISGEVYPEPKLSYVSGDGLQFVVPVCFTDFEAVRSNLQKNATTAL